MRNMAGKTHSGKLTVDEDDTFVYAVGSDKAPLNGKIIRADNTWSVCQHMIEPITVPMKNGALPVVGDCSYGLVVAAVLVPQGKP